MFWNPKTIPVLLAGLWPAQKGDPESGARILIHEKVGAPEILTGFSDTSGNFRGTISGDWAGKRVRVVIVEPSFLFEDYDKVEVQKWGLFLPIKQKKDLVYNGTKGAKTIDPVKWSNWNTNQEFANASELTHSAARRAKSSLPIGIIMIFVAIVLGFLGFIINPSLGLALGVSAAYVGELMSQRALLKGY